MKGRNLKLFTAILAVVLVAGGIIFYACKKENSEKKLTKEADFVAKNYDGTCVQVDILRDENNNAQFVIKNVADDPKEKVAFMVSNAITIEPLPTKDAGGVVFEIPNDAIYWVVPFDGNEPFKFETLEDAGVEKTGTVTATCKTCNEWYTNHPSCVGTACKEETVSGKTSCAPANNSCCTSYGCRPRTVVKSVKTDDEVIFVGSVYLVKSNSITLNGITYE